jgi:ribose 5-phosphate isomerase A
MNDKEIVAQAALEYVKNNTIIGLGTGSTANYFIEGLAKKIKNENLDIKVVASSTISQINAIQAGLTYVSLDQIEAIDLYVDGADEIVLSTSIEVLKGRGYDLIREKLLASASKQCIIIGDNSKIVTKIGDNFPIPVETSPIAWKITQKIIEEFSINCNLRKNTAGDGFAISSYGNFVLDCNFKYSDISSLSKQLSEVPGVLEHGVFLNIAHLSLIANNGEVETYKSI